MSDHGKVKVSASSETMKQFDLKEEMDRKSAYQAASQINDSGKGVATVRENKLDVLDTFHD